MSQYCHSCGTPLDESDLGWVSAVKVGGPGARDAVLGERPVELHVECRNELHAVGVRYRVVSVAGGDPGGATDIPQ